MRVWLAWVAALVSSLAPAFAQNADRTIEEIMRRRAVPGMKM